VAGPSIVSRWGGRAAESLFVLFPSDCRICGTPLVTISRLPEPSPGGLRLLEGVLERKPDTRPQTGLTSPRRRENMLGAFTVGRPEEVKGRPLVVVDDVCTSGTNVSECGRVLHRAASKGWPQWRGRSRYRHAKWKSCEVRKAMKRLSGWRKPPEAKPRGVRRTFVWRDAVRLP
jgi:hypothetical protein